MQRKARIAAIGVGWAAALLLLVSAPALAQEDQGEVTTAQEGAATTVTEVTSNAAAVLDVTQNEIVAAAGVEDVAADAATKTELQGQDKLEATAEGGSAPDNKALLFLPQIGGGSLGDAEASSTTAYWRNIAIETFEGLFPSGYWRAYDGNGTSYGQYYWDDDDYKPYSGRWSAWAANGGINGRDPQYYYYPNRADSWMVYGPFSLRYAQSARLFFRYWNQSERNFDYFNWYYSCNGVNFYGVRVSGDSGGWQYRYLTVPCTGDSTVWIAFRFTSDGSIIDDGPFVDNVYIQEYR